jgi:GTP-binding protein
MFIDKVIVRLKAGKGGNGVVSWRREKYIPKGGPCGGDGGVGGSVIIQSDTQIFSLDWFRNRRQLKAHNGEQGASNSKHGRNGQHLILKVPCGTLVRDPETKEILFDFTEDGQEFLICQGGKGGRGNESFKTPTNQAPIECTPGLSGDEREVELELKLIADVGLVGFPNAGKSTLINALGRGRAKIGAYPFTTLHPNLGYFETPTYTRITLADIPGIIQGASLDRGLGLEFLRHIERTKLLLFLLDASGIEGRTPIEDLKTLQSELQAYDPKLLAQPSLYVLNKVDEESAIAHVAEFYHTYPHLQSQTLEISALTGQGLPALKEKITSFF